MYKFRSFIKECRIILISLYNKRFMLAKPCWIFEIFRYPTNDWVILGTSAIEVGDELWVGQVAGGTRIARVPLR